MGRHLKALGLKRGVLTEEQTARLKELFEEHRGRRQCYQLIADGLENGCAAPLCCRHIPAAGPSGDERRAQAPPASVGLLILSCRRTLLLQDVEGPGGEPAAQAGPEARPWGRGRPPLSQC